ncbi:sortase [Candidatus Saccharibacteria bacterium]|nr:sortase [Candidatus Saccharibacteria bacterium]
MDSKNGGPTLDGKSRKTAAEIARAKVLAAYNSEAKKERKAIKGLGRTAKNLYLGTYKDAPIDAKKTQSAPTAEELKKYHSAWQNYYQKYYSDYYSKAAKSYLENEKLKTERRAHDNAVLESPELATDPTDAEEQSMIQTLKNHVKKRALAQNKTSHRLRKFVPLFAGTLVVLLILFLQYNRLIFAPIMAYVSPGNSDDSGISAIDPTITTAVGADNRLMIPKLNVDVPVNFGIANDTNTINMAMENGVAQFSIPGASAMPGEIGNLVITGHSAGDIYSNNQYKFIFSGLERLGNNDLIYIDYQGTRYTYSVIKKETVEPTNVGALVYDTDKPMLTLITCTPLGTSRYRLLVTAEQINPSPSGATQSDTTDDEADAPTFEAMPENEPTFFERIWRFLTGQN